MELLTIRQAAKRGPLNESTLRRRVRQGQIPGFTSGNRFLVNYDAMMEQLDRESRESVRTGG